MITKLVASPLGDALTATGASITAGFNEILPIALQVAGGILVATIGWKIFRRFVKA